MFFLYKAFGQIQTLKPTKKEGNMQKKTEAMCWRVLNWTFYASLYV